VLGSVARIMKMIVARRIELRDSTIFILGNRWGQMWPRPGALGQEQRSNGDGNIFRGKPECKSHVMRMRWTPASLRNIPGSSKLN
jgi:hypothetical protein